MIWSAVLVALVAFLLVFSEILPPFIFGAAIAYFCDPVADWVERRGLSRLAATAAVLFMAILIFALLAVAVLPLLLDQFSALMRNLPGYIDTLRGRVEGLMGTIEAVTPADESKPSVKPAAEQLRDAATGIGGKLLQSIWSGGVAFVSALAIVVVTPVVAFYLLLDWDRLVASVDDLIPRRHLGETRGLARDIDDVLAGFMRGQFLVCIIQGTFYAIALSLIGLDFALIVGMISGMASFIPYVGAILGLTLSMGLAFTQFWGDWASIAMVLGIFVAGQAVEGNILSPWLVGNSVGLHPVWLIFSLAAFGSLFGFAGLLLAVPAAAVIGVLTRYAVGRYQDSTLYAEDDAPAAGKRAPKKPATARTVAVKPAPRKPAPAKAAEPKPAPGKPTAAKPSSGKTAARKPATGKPGR